MTLCPCLGQFPSPCAAAVESKSTTGMLSQLVQVISLLPPELEAKTSPLWGVPLHPRPSFITRGHHAHVYRGPFAQLSSNRWATTGLRSSSSCPLPPFTFLPKPITVSAVPRVDLLADQALFGVMLTE